MGERARVLKKERVRKGEKKLEKEGGKEEGGREGEREIGGKGASSSTPNQKQKQKVS